MVPKQPMKITVELSLCCADSLSTAASVVYAEIFQVLEELEKRSKQGAGEPISGGAFARTPDELSCKSWAVSCDIQYMTLSEMAKHLRDMEAFASNMTGKVFEEKEDGIYEVDPEKLH